MLEKAMTMRTIIMTALTLAWVPSLSAQDGDVAQKAENFYLEVARPVVTPLQSSAVSIRLYYAGENFERNVAAGGAASFTKNYAITNWRILEKGDVGQITSTTGDQALFTAPSKKPAQGFVTVAVDLVPKTPKHPKVALLGQIAITEEENTFLLEVGGLGIKGERYILGSGENSQLAGVVARMTPAQQAMVAERMKQKGVDAGAALKKARAFYSRNDDATTVLIEIPRVSQQAGTVSMQEQGIVTITFKGHGPGTFQVMPNKDPDNKNMVGIVRPGGQQFVAGHEAWVPRGDGTKELHIDCPGCRITVDAYDDKFVQGSVNSEMLHFVGEHAISGRLIGKFKVPLAN